MTRTRTQSLAFAALLAMAAIWGSTFFLIKDLATRLGVLDLLALRFAVAAAALAVLAAPRLRIDATVLRRGVPLGLLYGTAQILQTTGLSLTPASAAGFITACTSSSHRCSGPCSSAPASAARPGRAPCWPRSGWACCRSGARAAGASAAARR